MTYTTYWDYLRSSLVRAGFNTISASVITRESLEALPEGRGPAVSFSSVSHPEVLCCGQACHVNIVFVVGSWEISYGFA